MGTYAFVRTSRIWIRPLPEFGGHLAGAGAPERPFLPELHEQMWHEPRYQHSCRILSKYRIMGYQSNRPIKGIPKLDHFQTLPIHKCTMCDFPNFSARSNDSRFSSISDFPGSDGLIDTPLAYTWTVFDKKVDMGGHATAAREALEGGVFPALQLRPDVS